MKHFIKKKQDFVCDNCGAKIYGDGYTNHCTECLYSKHVDVNPGDRQATCGGLMQPIDVIQKGDGYIILHKCMKCGFERKNKFSDDDNFASLISLVKKLNATRR